MTKDRPRNRPGNGRKSGPFRESGGPKGGGRFGAGGGDREQGESGRDNQAGRSNHEGGGQKPWHKSRSTDRGRNNAPRQFDRREPSFEENGEVWIWGLHAAGAALANPKRRISKAYVSPNGAVRAGFDPKALPKFAELMEPRDIDMKLPAGAVHQGLAVRCKPLEGADISDASMRPERSIAILDQVTDPQNVGAIFRSAAAFGVGAVVMQTRNAPAAGGALAKAAVGALEVVDEVRVVNISRAIDELRDAGWKVIGLAGEAELTLDQAVKGSEPVAIVLGAEGPGIRYQVGKACTLLARIPMHPGMESLNVSNAAAIAFYEAMRRNGAAAPPPKAARPAHADDGGFEDEAD